MEQKKYSERKKAEMDSAKSETIGVISIIITAFVLVCLLTSDLFLGAVGEIIKNVTLGLVGYSAYPILLFFFVYGILKVKKVNSSVPVRYIVLGTITAVLILVIAHLISAPVFGSMGEYIAKVYTDKTSIGGLVFGFLGYCFVAPLGAIVGYCVLIALVVLMAFFMLKNAFKISVGEHNSKSDKKGESVGGFSAPSNPNGLFVGTIIPTDARSRESYGFDDIKERDDALPDMDRRVVERVYDYERARRILFEENKTAYRNFLPLDAQAAPSVTSSTQQKKEEPVSYHHEVPVPAPKNFEHHFVPGEIVNGDAVSERMQEELTVEEPKTTSVESQPTAPIYTSPTYTTPSYTPPQTAPIAPKTEPKKSEVFYNPAPIINGDYYVEGEDAPTVESMRIDYSTSTFEASVPTQPETIEENTESTVPFEPIVTQSPIEESPSYIDEPIVDDEEEVDDQYSYDDEEVESEQLEDDTPVEQTDPIVEEDYVDEEEETIEGSITIESEEDGETELSRAFEESTTSFRIIDEVEDASERGYNNPNDTTGYYEHIDITPTTPVEPVAPPVQEKKETFEERVESVSRKMTSSRKTEEGQIDIETFMTASASQKDKDEPKPKPKKRIKYTAPPLDLLVTESTQPEQNPDDNQEKREILEETLRELGVPATVSNITIGPAITRYELDMPPGMSVRRMESLAPDIRYNLASKGQVRIESPIPGKRAVGVEVPNDTIYTVALKDIIGSKEFKNSPSPLTIALGKDIQGNVMITRLEKMPHLLIAGATGSGKSSCLNSLLISLLYKSSPDDVKLILIDPKRVEFTAYSGLPHMMIANAITDVAQAINAFKWAHDEMERRYVTLQKKAVKEINEYNNLPEVKEGLEPKMTYIVVVVDELANLMMASKENQKLLEEIIMAIASKARAAGIHLVLATQRPSVNVITGTIKANLPSRIAFAVTSAQDSRIILDNNGAESLLGRGDMLFAPLDQSEETRIQGAYVDNPEVKSVVEFVKTNNPADYDKSFEDSIIVKQSSGGGDKGGLDDTISKELFMDVVRCIIKCGMASSSMIQRRFNLGFNKAAKMIDHLEALEFVGPQNNSKPREVYVTKEKFKEYFGEDYE